MAGTEYIVIPTDGLAQPTRASILVNGEPISFEVREIKKKKTREEKAEQKRLYRKEYNQTPKQREKMLKKMNDPEAIAKRKAYSELPYVKDRKKLQSQRSREIKRKLKQQDYSLYLKILCECPQTQLLDAMKMPKTPRPKKEKKNQELITGTNV